MIPTNWLSHRAASRPGALALRDREGRSLSYGELLRRASAGRRHLRSRGALCAVRLEPGLEHGVVINAAMLAGVPFQTVRPGSPAEEAASALAGADWFEADPVWFEGDSDGGEDEAGPQGGDDPLCRVLTSGTSGIRRPVALTWANHFSSAAASALRLGVRGDDRWLCCMPVDHVGGLSILVRSLIYGTAAVVHPGFDTDAVIAELAADVSLVSLVPTQLQRLLEAGAALERARVILVGGGPVPASVLDEALERGANVVQTYGLTEACSQVSTLGAVDAWRKRGSAGRALEGTVIEIEDDEILVSGPTIAPGASGDDGRLRTGDRGHIDEDGFLWVEGRLDDLIISGGENIAPQEVEAVLMAHPSVADVAVFGRPDPEWGHAVSAHVVAAEGAEAQPERLREHCRRALAPYKVPKSIEIVGGLPRTATGKLLRHRLG